MKKSACLFILLLFGLAYPARFRADTVWATKGGYVFGALTPTSATADSLIAIVAGDSIAKKIRHGYAQIVTVAKSGGNYTTIQAAINSVLDASETKRYCVYVYPGLYIEQVTMKKFVDLSGVNKQTTQVQFTGNNNGTIILADSVQVCDISVKTTTPSTEWGVVGTNISNVFIRDFDVSSPTYIAGLNSSGVKLTGTVQNVRLERVVINCHSTTGIDLYVAGSASTTTDPGVAIHDSYFSTFDATSGGCVYIKDQADVFIMNCYMRTSAVGYNLVLERTGTTATNVTLVNNRMLYGTSSVEVGANCSLWVENTFYSSIDNSGTIISEIGHHHNNLYDSIADTAVVRVVSGKVGIGTAPSSRFLRVQRQVEILGNATLGGRGLIESITTSGREYMIARADSVNALGAGWNLYGNSDTYFPGGITLNVGGHPHFVLDSTGRVDSIYELKMRWLAAQTSDTVVTADVSGLLGRRSGTELVKSVTFDSLNGVNFKITKEGGYAVRLLNRTGATSVKGYLASPSPYADTACTLSTQDVPDVIGVFYESGVAAGSLAWVVIAGIADVYFVGNATRGHVARGFVAGEGTYIIGQAISEAVPSSPFATDKHFYELGHVIQNHTGAGLARCVLHQN